MSAVVTSRREATMVPESTDDPSASSTSPKVRGVGGLRLGHSGLTEEEAASQIWNFAIAPSACSSFEPCDCGGGIGETAEMDASFVDADLEAFEASLTKDVPALLEKMNNAASEVNLRETEVSEAQARYRQLLDRWSRLYEDMRTQYGSVIERARPYFEAVQLLTKFSHRVQDAVKEFSAAASEHTSAKADLRAIEERLAYGAHQMALDQDQQDGLSRATVRVVAAQQTRDLREREYARALKEYQDAQKVVEAHRVDIGDSAIRRALPCFRQLEQRQSDLAAEQKRLNQYQNNVRSAKDLYSSSLRELDRISTSVHEARQAMKHGTFVSNAALTTFNDATEHEEQSRAEARVFGDENPEVAGAEPPEPENKTSSLVVEDDDGPFA